MIIDADCHLSSRRFDPQALLADDLVARMDKAGVDKALIWLRPRYDRQVAEENRAVAEAARRFPGRFLPFGWVNPLLGDQPCRDELKRCFGEYGFLGVKFNGAQDGYVIDDEAVLPLVELAASFGRPIAFHIGADFYENTHPWRLGRIAVRFPQTRFLMVHMGGAGTPPLARAAIETAAAHPNITVIASALQDAWIERALDALGPDRVCFGSDSPFALMHAQKALWEAILKQKPAEWKEKAMGRTIVEALSPAA